MFALVNTVITGVGALNTHKCVVTNINRMRKAASSLLAHADAFEAEWRSRRYAAGH